MSRKSPQKIAPKISNIGFKKPRLPRKRAILLKNYPFKTPLITACPPRPPNLQTFPRPCSLIRLRCIRSNASPMEAKSLCSYLDFESYSPKSSWASLWFFIQLRLKVRILSFSWQRKWKSLISYGWFINFSSKWNRNKPSE